MFNPPPVSYWRYVWLNHGELCSMCAWVVKYMRLGVVSVHESSLRQVHCCRCDRWHMTHRSHVDVKRMAV